MPTPVIADMGAPDAAGALDLRGAVAIHRLRRRRQQRWRRPWPSEARQSKLRRYNGDHWCSARRATVEADLMILTRLSLAIATLFAVGATAPARADVPLAGARLVTSSHGQPFCKDRAELQALLRATIAKANFPFGSFPGCGIVPDNATVTVLEDLSPRSRSMHVVRARVDLLFGPLEAYTYSAGLYSEIIRPRGPFGVVLPFP
jgi:hypothetical protein